MLACIDGVCVAEWWLAGLMVALSGIQRRQILEGFLCGYVNFHIYLFILFKTGPYVGQTGLDFTV